MFVALRFILGLGEALCGPSQPKSCPFQRLESMVVGLTANLLPSLAAERLQVREVTFG